MRVLKRDQTRGVGQADIGDSPPAALKSNDAGADLPAAATLPFSVQLDGQWHAGIHIAPDVAVVEGPIDADTYGEIRDCRLLFPYGLLEIAVVRRAEILRDEEFLGAARLQFPRTRSPARAELAALIRLLSTRNRRPPTPPPQEGADAALLAAVPGSAPPAGMLPRLRRWLKGGHPAKAPAADQDAP